MVYLSNAFSLQMQGENECNTKKISVKDVYGILFKEVPGPYIDRESERDGSDTVLKMIAISVIGHADVANIIGGLIGHDVPVNRVSIQLQAGDKLVVGQYIGQRLPEGCKKLPADSRIDWYLVECHRSGYQANVEGVMNDLLNKELKMCKNAV